MQKGYGDTSIDLLNAALVLDTREQLADADGRPRDQIVRLEEINALSASVFTEKAGANGRCPSGTAQQQPFERG